MASATTGRRLGPLEEIPPGEGRAYVTEGRQVAVFRLRDGGLRALDAVCPHAGGPLADGQIDGAVVVCPLHLNAWSLEDGSSRAGLAPIATYEVSVDEDGMIVVSD